jgi:hypothetical protein
MPWAVLFHAEFASEFGELTEVVQDALLATLGYVRDLGPGAGRPAVDTLNGSKYANMKELRFRSSGSVWRFAFAFDPKRNAVVLCGGSKSGTSERRFYRVLIDRADKRFASYLASLGE